MILCFWGPWYPTLSPEDHPTDEDLSVGTPARRKDGARSWCMDAVQRRCKASLRPYGTRKRGRGTNPGFKSAAAGSSWAILGSSLREGMPWSTGSSGERNRPRQQELFMRLPAVEIAASIYPATERMALTPAPSTAVSSSGGITSREKLCSGLILTMVSRWLRSSGSSRKRTLEPVK
jgi:hypothetical protein